MMTEFKKKKKNNQKLM